MIIFYEKKSGKIVGTIDGRIHSPEHLKMWIGDKKETARLVIQWKPTGKETVKIIEEPIYKEYVDDDGFTETHQVGTKKRKEKIVEFEPDCSQKKLIAEIEKNSSKLYNYKVNTKTKKLIKK